MDSCKFVNFFNEKAKYLVLFYTCSFGERMVGGFLVEVVFSN
jgi:hypothetical protein